MVHCRHRIARCQHNELVPSCIEKRSGRDRNRRNALTRDRFEGEFDLRIGADSQFFNLQIERARRLAIVYCPSSSRRNSSTASFACFANRSASLTGSLSATSTREIHNFPICLQSAETSNRYLCFGAASRSAHT